MASINGTSGIDTLNGTADPDTISGLAGNDTIHGLGGNDTLSGGAGDDLIFGEEGNDVLNGGTGADTMQGGVGDDIYVIDNLADQVIEANGEGTDLVKSTISLALLDNLENLTLGGGAAIDGTGNDLANVLIGNRANNILDGLGGADTMRGGAGNDTYVVDDVHDLVVESASAGIDLVRSSVSFRLGRNIENLTLTGTEAIDATGNELSNTLTGNGAANVLDGKTGADTMAGGAGDDIYVVDDAGDLVVEDSALGGRDTVKAYVSFILPDNVEDLTLAGIAAINGTGNSMRNVLVGNEAANVLDGGAGADTMNGRGGNDSYLVDDIGDRVIEGSETGGTDRVYSTLSYTLGANIENLTLIGSDTISGTGNALANAITGNVAANVISGGDGDDTLDGGGGDDSLDGGIGNDILYGGSSGADTLTGGAGNDTYNMFDADTIVELDFGGTDTALVHINGSSFVVFTLPQFVENATLIEATKFGFNDGTLLGNSLNNVLIGDGGSDFLSGDDGNDILGGAGGSDTLWGGNGNDQLTGGSGNDDLSGGTGADTMVGGTGNDTYHLDSLSDVVTENSGEGLDTVYLTVGGYTLANNVENLVIDSAAGLTMIANSLNNTITGGAGNDDMYGHLGVDTIHGGGGDDFVRGGAGGDILYGDAGADTFANTLNTDVLTTAPDTIMDFVSGTDKIKMSMDANLNVSGHQSFSWSFFPNAGAGHWWFGSDASIPNLYHLYFDLNGGGADMQIDVYTTGLAVGDVIG